MTANSLEIKSGELTASALDLIKKSKDGLYSFKKVDSRTLAQNDYFHAIVREFMRRCAEEGSIYTFDVCKNLFKILIGWYEDAGQVKCPLSTANLSKKEFTFLIALASEWWLEWYEEPIPNVEDLLCR